MAVISFALTFFYFNSLLNLVSLRISQDPYLLGVSRTAYKIAATNIVKERGCVVHKHHKKKECKKKVKELHLQPPTARADAFPFVVVCDVGSDLSFIGLLDVMCPTSVGIRRETFQLFGICWMSCVHNRTLVRVCINYNQIKQRFGLMIVN